MFFFGRLSYKVVHKKYIRKNGKTFGPYLYESKRVGDKVTTNYVGKKDAPHELNRYVFPLVIVFLLGVCIGIFLVYMFFPPHLIGKVTLDLKQAYTAGESLSGSLLVTLRQGELLPADSTVRVSVGDVSRELPLSKLVKGPTTQGTFFIEGLRLNGSGKGYGSLGSHVSSPPVYFSFKLTTPTSTSSSGSPSTRTPSQSAGASEIPDKPIPSSEEPSSDQGSEDNGGASSVTAFVISSSTIEGVTQKDEPFEYTLPSDSHAKLVSGSVTVDGKPVSDGVISFRESNGKLIVSTNYAPEESGFGSEYLGDSTVSVSLDLSQFGVILDHSVPLSLELYHNDQLLLRAERNIIVEDLNDSLSVNVDVVRQRIVVGKPVKWTKHVSLSDPATLTVNLPQNAQEVEIVSSEESNVRTTDHVIVTTIGDDSDVSVQQAGVPVDEIHVATQQHIDSDGNQEVIHHEVQAVAAVTGNVVNEGLSAKAKGIYKSISGYVIADNNPKENVVEISDPVDSITLEYYTEAPTITEEDTRAGKQVIVSGPETVRYENVLAYTTVPETYNIQDPSFLSIYWVNEHQYVTPETVQDVDGNGIYDYVEWNVEHLSNQTFVISYQASQAAPAYSFQFIPSQTCASESYSTMDTFGLTCQGTYPGSCGLSGDRLSCNDNITEMNSYGYLNYAGIRVSSYNASVTDCKSIQSVYVCYNRWINTSSFGGGEAASFNVSQQPIWEPLANGVTCAISADADDGTSYSTVNSTCPGSVPSSVICTNVTALEPWTCSNFFGSSGTRAKLQIQMGGTTLSNEYFDTHTDVLAFNVTYVPVTDIYSCGELNVPNTVYTQFASLAPTGNAPCINITANNVTFNGNGYNITNLSYTGKAIYSNSLGTIVNYANVVVSSSGGYGLFFNNSLNSSINNSVATGYVGVALVSSNGALIHNSAFTSASDGIQVFNSTHVRIESSEIFSSGGYSIALYNTTNASLLATIINQSSLDGVYIEGGRNNSIISSYIFNTQRKGLLINSSSNTYVYSSIFNNTAQSAISIGNVLSVNTTLSNVTFINTAPSAYDLAFTDASINRTTIIDTSVGGYSFTGVGGLVTVTRTGIGRIRFLQPINGSGSNFNSDVFITTNYTLVNAVQTGLNKSANITLFNMPNDYRAAMILRDGSPCPNSICRNLTSLPLANVTFNVTSWSTYSLGILPCFSINACSEGSVCTINLTCQMDNSQCTNNICDFTNFTISAPLYTGSDGIGNGNSLTLNISGNFTFLTGNKIDFSGLNGTIGGGAGKVNITVPGLFNRTGAVFRGIGGYTSAPGDAGGDGGILQVNYHGLVGSTSSWTRVLGAGGSFDSGSGVTGTTVQAKSLTCPRDADVNDDGRIASADFLLIALHYNNVSSDDTFNLTQDVNCDGKTNVIDLAKIAFEIDRA